MKYRHPLCLGSVALVCVLWLTPARAQEPKIFLDADDVTADPGQTVAVSVFINNLPDSVAGYEILLSMSRPDLGIFLPSFDQAGTLTDGWGGSAQVIADHNLRIFSTAGTPPGWTPIPPTTPGTLVKCLVQLYCDIPDTMQDRRVNLDISIVGTYFATPGGMVIEPLDFTQGSVTAGLRCPHQGDAEPDGFVTALDLTAIIGILFEGGQNPQDTCCPIPRFDFDCDGFVNALDLSVIIDYLFAGDDGPCSP